MNKSLKTLLVINGIFVVAGNLLGPLFIFMSLVALGCALFTFSLPRKAL